MNGTFLENRLVLVEVLSSMDSFTEEELLAAYAEKRKGSLAISGVQTVGDYLQDLAQFGGLRYEYGRYWTMDR